MVQHLLLSLVAAPLLLLSSSMPVLLWALSPRDRATLGRLVGQPGPVRTAAPLAHPAGRRLDALRGHPVALAPAGRLRVGARESLGALPRARHASSSPRSCSGGRSSASPPLPSPLSYPARLAYTFLAWLPNSFLGAGISLSRGPAVPALRRRRRSQRHRRRVRPAARRTDHVGPRRRPLRDHPARCCSSPSCSTKSARKSASTASSTRRRDRAAARAQLNQGPYSIMYTTQPLRAV